jgi:hypothetical protein
MQPVTAPAPARGPSGRPDAPRGRWIWRVSGTATVAALSVAALGIATHADTSGPDAVPWRLMTKSLAVPQPVTSVRVLTSGSPVRVTAGPGSHVQVTEAIQYDSTAYDPKAYDPSPADPNANDPKAGAPPMVPASVSHGLLTLNGSACDPGACAVAFWVTVPRGTSVNVSSAGGDVVLSGTAGAVVDSGGGNVYAAGLRGPLSVVTGNGSLVINGLAGSLYADTSGGSVDGSGLATPTATVITGGGDAWLGYAAAPGTVMASTDGGGALLALPPGPYALTADSGGADQVVTVGTDPTAQRSITVTSGGGSLQVEPPTAGSLPPIPPLPRISADDPFGPQAPADVPAPPLPPGQ